MPLHLASKNISQAVLPAFGSFALKVDYVFNICFKIILPFVIYICKICCSISSRLILFVIGHKRWRKYSHLVLLCKNILCLKKKSLILILYFSAKKTNKKIT